MWVRVDNVAFAQGSGGLEPGVGVFFFVCVGGEEGRIRKKKMFILFFLMFDYGNMSGRERERESETQTERIVNN